MSLISDLRDKSVSTVGGRGREGGVTVTVAVMSCDQRLVAADQSVLPPLFAEQLVCFLAGKQDVV